MSVSVAPAAPTAKKAWLVNAPVDLLIGCGGWTIPLLLLARGIDASGLISIAFIFYFLTIFCNNPHYMATIYRAYGRPQDFHKYKLFTVYITVMLALTGVMTHFAPVLLPVLFTIYLTWSPWHYTAQNYGIAMMFLGRRGMKPSLTEKRIIYGGYLASYLLWFLTIHSIFSANAYFITLEIPQSVAQIGGSLCMAVFLFAAIYSIWFVMKRGSLSAGAPFLLLCSTQFLWFVAPIAAQGFALESASPVYFTAGALAFMHCAQYLWVTNYYAQREADTPAWNFRSYYLMMVLGGIALFLPGPWLISRVFQYNLLDSFLIFVALINIHHFILDGAIWKLRDSRIGALLLGSGQPEVHQSEHHHAAPFRVLTVGPARYFLVGGLVAVAAADQAQYFLTLENSPKEYTRIAAILNPNDSRVWQSKAQAALAEGDREAAREALDHAMDLTGVNAATRRMRGSLLLETGDLENAWTNYRELERYVYPDLPTFVNIGVLAANQGDTGAAEEKFLKALRIDPERKDVRLNLAELYFQKGNFAASASHYAEWLRLAPKNPDERELRTMAEVTMRLGSALQQSSQLGEAEEFLLRALALAQSQDNPALSMDAHRALAELYAEARQFAPAVRQWRAAIEIADRQKYTDYHALRFSYALMLVEGRALEQEALAILFDLEASDLSPDLAALVRRASNNLSANLPEETVQDIITRHETVYELAMTFDPET